jgi:hypothetical protein
MQKPGFKNGFKKPDSKTRIQKTGFKRLDLKPRF